MAEAAPRISPRLLEAIALIDDGERPIAEICRAVGRRSGELGLPRPSYEQVRVLVQRERRWKRARRPTTSVLAEVAFRSKPPTAVLDHLAGTS